MKPPRASRRAEKIIRDKAIRKIRRIREIAARQGYTVLPPSLMERGIQNGSIVVIDHEPSIIIAKGTRA